MGQLGPKGNAWIAKRLIGSGVLSRDIKYFCFEWSIFALSCEVKALNNNLPSVEVPLYSKIVTYKKGGKQFKKRLWSVCEEGHFDRVEIAALEFFKGQGFSGVHDEGLFVNQTMRAGMLYDLTTKKDFMSFFGDFADPRNLFAQGLMYSASDAGGRTPFLALTQGELVEKIRNAPKDKIIDFINNDIKSGRFHASPRWDEDQLRRYYAFLDVVSCELLANIAERQNASGAYAGFPDLTLWRGADLNLVEVKSPTDKLTPNQIGSFCNVFLPLSINLRIANVKNLCVE